MTTVKARIRSLFGKYRQGYIWSCSVDDGTMHATRWSIRAVPVNVDSLRKGDGHPSIAGDTHLVANAAREAHLATVRWGTDNISSFPNGGAADTMNRNWLHPSISAADFIPLCIHAVFDIYEMKIQYGTGVTQIS